MFEKLFEKLPPIVKAKFMTDHVRIRGTVIIRNGNRIVVAQNRIVSQGMRLLMTWLFSVSNVNNYGGGSILFSTQTVYSRMRFGSDTTHATTEDMIALSNEITTDRNTAGVTLSKVASGQYRVAWVSTWNAGTVSGTLGEVGLFLTGITPYADASLPLTNQSPSVSSSPYLFSRLSSASGDFASFTINAAVPLTIEWRLEFTF